MWLRLVFMRMEDVFLPFPLITGREGRSVAQVGEAKFYLGVIWKN
jgi:hypothetical protein